MTALVPLAIGFVLDLALGDPRWMPHPVVAIGKMISLLEKAFRALLPRTRRGELVGGALLVLVVASLSFAVPHFLLALAEQAHPYARLCLECLVCYQVLATKCLRDAGLRVYRELKRGDLPGARNAVAMIVGRDTQELDAPAVTRAAVETLAENASDGVVAPMLYFAIGGAPLALLYKAVNTMDSMLGYKNEKYFHFGKTAARLDDVANFIPARLTAALMIPAAALCRLDWRGALAIYRRDRKAHSSPNAGHPEAACAGALGVRLGGDSVYGGRVVGKPTLGDAGREIEAEDIRRTGGLVYACAALCFLVCCAATVLAARCMEGMAWN